MNMTSNAYMVSPQSKGRPDLVKFKRIRWHGYAYVVIWGVAIIILSGLTILRTILKFGKKGYSSYKVQVLNQSSQ
jgi:hypothetical protein